MAGRRFTRRVGLRFDLASPESSAAAAALLFSPAFSVLTPPRLPLSPPRFAEGRHVGPCTVSSSTSHQPSTPTDAAGSIPKSDQSSETVSDAHSGGRREAAPLAGLRPHPRRRSRVHAQTISSPPSSPRPRLPSSTTPSACARSAAVSLKRLPSVSASTDKAPISILNDLVISRVFAEAGFRSGDIKLAILCPAPPMPLLGCLPMRTHPLPLFLCSFAATDDVDVPSPVGNIVGAGEENCRRIAEILSRGCNSRSRQSQALPACPRHPLPQLHREEGNE
uniref:Uncharacterized protein n=1 Tax=Oryza glumipatula TaxID=40148 RepID=A0A0E0BBN7_9ORYZ